LKRIALIAPFILNGCWFWGQKEYHDIVVHSSAQWSQKECLTIIVGAQNNNLTDYRTNIKAIATPYYPSVVRAIARRAQAKYAWSKEEFQSYVDGLLRQGSGMYIDWDRPGEQIYDHDLNPLSGPAQFDSLMFLLTLRNVGWPCGKTLIIGDQVIPLDNVDCQAPDITLIEGKIYLVNEKGNFITPRYVYGRKMNYLTNIDETLFVLFTLKEGGHHFLEGSGRFFLAIKGLEDDIRLEFQTQDMR